MKDENSIDQADSLAVPKVEEQPKALSIQFCDRGMSGEQKLWDIFLPVVVSLVLGVGAFHLQDNAKQSGQNLSGIFIKQTDLLAPRSGAYLQGNELSESKLYEPRLYDLGPGYSELDYTKLDYSKIDYAKLDYSKIDYAKLDYSKIDYAKLDYSKLDYAKLDYSKLDYAKLDYSKLDKTRLGR